MFIKEEVLSSQVDKMIQPIDVILILVLVTLLLALWID
jgi:hypothetical protein